MKGISYAINGFKTAFKTEVNIKTHFAATLVVVLFGWFFEISAIEWILIAGCVGLVISMEMMNTAVEYLVDFVSPEIHVKAGKIKDISAGAVLTVALTALIVGLIIFIPKITVWLQGFA